MKFIEIVGYLIIALFFTIYVSYLRQFSKDKINVIWACFDTFEASVTLIMAITITLAIDHINN